MQETKVKSSLMPARPVDANMEAYTLCFSEQHSVLESVNTAPALSPLVKFMEW